MCVAAIFFRHFAKACSTVSALSHYTNEDSAHICDVVFAEAAKNAVYSFLRMFLIGYREELPTHS